MKRLIIFLILICTTKAFSQENIRIEPPHWWTEMKNPLLQLMIKGENIASYIPLIEDRRIKVIDIHKCDSPNYIFIDLDISNSTEGRYLISFHKGQEKKEMYYELKRRESKAASLEGFNSSDVIYLITPDRFANGDPSNDSFQNLQETVVDRSQDYTRHGGDIQGIIDHLDYIEEMGFTAIWSSPLLINDMPQWSYHGYAITDLYRVDPRFGTIEDYRKLSKEAAKRSIKLIMDMVANHSGSNHWWMDDLPFRDWVNDVDSFQVCNHRRTVNQDPYASQIDKRGMEKGWFVPEMPDLNQENPFMARYIIQNNIWWIETLQLRGIRQDTYPYPNKEFMSQWAKEIMYEYPNFSIVGEEWSYNPLLIAYWQQGADNKDGYQSNIDATMDFAMQQNIIAGISEKESWDKGLVKIYEGLANDFHYPNPLNILLFGDNHDMDRMYTQLNRSIENTKMALALIITMPRIPQIYYGTEALIDNSEKPGDHGLIRTDMPGGWKGDTVNVFSGVGLTKDQQEMRAFLKTLLNYRKGSDVIHTGKTLHYAPEKGVYVLCRHNDEQKVVTIINKNEEDIILSIDRYEEIFGGYKRAHDILQNVDLQINEGIKLMKKGVTILELDQ